MTIIKIKKETNGAHANQTVSGAVTPPDGWAAVPDGMTVPASFPFVDIVVENGVVTSMTEAAIPEPEPDPEPEPSELERLRADVDYIAVMTGVTL